MNRVKIIITTDCDKVVLKASLCKDADDKMQFLQSFKCPDCLSSLLLKLSVAASNQPMELSLAPDGRKDPFPFESDVDLHSEVELGPEMIKDDEDLNMPQVHPANLYPQQSMTEKRLGDIWLEENDDGIDHIGNRSAMMQSEKGSSDFDSDPETNGSIDPMKVLKLVDNSRMMKKPFKKKMTIKEENSKKSNGTGNGSGKIFECTACRIFFRHRRGLDAHSGEEHSGPKDCARCGLTFETNSKLRRHTYEIHENVRTIYECSICPQIFKIRSKYDRHIPCHPIVLPSVTIDDTDHQGPPPNGIEQIDCIECKLCNIMYRYRRGLDAHAYEEHSGPKTCSQCEQTFASNSILRRHTFEVHDNIKNIHQCKYCPLTFKTKTKLHRHRSSHPDDDEIASASANNPLQGPSLGTSA